MNLANFPWEDVLISANDTSDMRATHPQVWAQKIFQYSVQLYAQLQTADPQDVRQLLAKLGIEAFGLQSRLGHMLERPAGDHSMLLACVRQGMLDQAAEAKQWLWVGVVGADITGIPLPQLKEFRVLGQAMLRWVARQPEAPTLAEVAEQLGDGPGRGMILRWTTQSLALVPGFCPRRGQPTLGRLAATALVSTKLAVLVPAPPTPSRPQSQTNPPPAPHTSRLDEDLLVVVAEIAMQPARLRQDWTLHVLDQKRLATCLPEVSGQSLDERLNRALIIAQALALIEPPDQSLHVTRLGKSWLRLGAGDRQRQVMAYLRNVMMGTELSSGQWHKSSDLYRQALRHTSHYINETQAWRILAAAWRELGSDTWLRQQALDWWASRPPADLNKALVKDWAAILIPALQGLALPLGLIVEGPATADVGSTICLTPAGRWAVGLADDWQPVSEVVIDRPIIVQADHSIVFLAKSPVLAAEINGFADRQPGNDGIGVLFKLSKAACRRAAAEGIDATAALEVLAAAASKPVPANVVRELTGWFGQVRKVQAAHVLLITAADEETATRLMGLKGAVRVGPLAVSLPGTAKSGELKKQLLKTGILLVGRERMPTT